METDQITPIGKLFFTSLLASIVNGAAFNWKLQGTKEQTEDLMKVIAAAKEAYEETKKGNQTTVQTLMEKMNKKQEALAEFEKKYGVRLPI
jgi:hypothetical protein